MFSAPLLQRSKLRCELDDRCCRSHRVELQFTAGKPARNDLSMTTVSDAAHVGACAIFGAVAEPAAKRPLTHESYAVPVAHEFVVHPHATQRIAVGVLIAWG